MANYIVAVCLLIFCVYLMRSVVPSENSCCFVEFDHPRHVQRLASPIRSVLDPIQSRPTPPESQLPIFDCDACVSECPVEAIYHVDNVPSEWKDFIALNAEMSERCPPITERKTPLVDR